MSFIEGLAATAQPVARRRGAQDLVIIALVVLVEVIGFSYFFDPERFAAYVDAAPRQMIMKIVLFSSLFVTSLAAALHSFEATARRLDPVILAGGSAVGLMGLMSFDYAMGPGLEATLLPRQGLGCLSAITLLSLPVCFAMGLLMTRAASVQPGRTALLIGLTGGAFGATLFSLICPYTSLWYIGVWYGGAIIVSSAWCVRVLPDFNQW
ncbi:hypothetical protein PB2503_02467 [Parvularcula bermudensis HTCC2503]|uniref:DUF1109 domain-containing protein n=2 Tax=Parvularcula TaxID=208215 RepID=E0TCI1_PARBH|nr:hypothetical protein PB2503_02467 [Parvularcula bermudensis HTCC2503]